MPEIIEKPAFKLVGLEGRTSNEKEVSGNGVVGQIIAQYYGEQLFAKIPDQSPPGFSFSLLNDYASDQNGEYTFTMGVPVEKTEGDLPEGVVIKNIPAGRYAVFVSERGPMPNVVIDLWSKIWSMGEKEMGGKPNFKANFEEYSAESGTPENMQVKIYISID